MADEKNITELSEEELDNVNGGINITADMTLFEIRDKSPEAAYLIRTLTMPNCINIERYGYDYARSTTLATICELKGLDVGILLGKVNFAINNPL